MDPTTHSNMIYGKFDKYIGKYDNPANMKMPTTGRAPAPIPNAIVITSNLVWSYGKVFDLSSKINSLVERVVPSDLQDPVRMGEKLSRASEITKNLEKLAKAQVNKDEQRGDFVNFWCRLGNALIGRGWLTGGERGVELAQEMMAHIQEKQQLVQQAKITENLTNIQNLVEKFGDPDGFKLVHNIKFPADFNFSKPIYVIIDEVGDVELYVKGLGQGVNLEDCIGKDECNKLKNILAEDPNNFVVALYTQVNTDPVRQALGA